MDYLSEENKEELKELYNNIPESWFSENITVELKVDTTLYCIADWDQEEYRVDVLNHMIVEYHTFSTHAMSDHGLYLQGQKNMLGALILIIKRS